MKYHLKEAKQRAVHSALDALCNHTPQQLYEIAWCDELHDGKELHGVIVSDHVREAAWLALPISCISECDKPE
jgi:hypothetical protein